MRDDILKFAALFCIELIIFIPIYVSDVYAIEPAISDINVVPSYNSAVISWKTDISSTRMIDRPVRSEQEPR